MTGLRITKNKLKELRGKAKEQTGDDLGDRSMRARGKTEKTTANLKQVGDKIKDAFKH